MGRAWLSAMHPANAQAWFKGHGKVLCHTTVATLAVNVAALMRLMLHPDLLQISSGSALQTYMER